MVYANEKITNFTFSPDHSVTQYVANIVVIMSQTWISFAYTRQLPRHDTMKLRMVENRNVWSYNSRHSKTFSRYEGEVLSKSGN
jgi:hypothetical protein